MNDLKVDGPYFDQEQPEIAPTRVLAEGDWSRPYELDAGAIFEAGSRFLLVSVSGCSCWPARGGTEQRIAETWADVDRIARELFGSHAGKMLDLAQATR